jgi:hypothetical protein
MAPSFTTILRALGRQKSYTTLNFIGLFVSITVAILTVSFQSIHAALANPVKSLRNE